MHDVYFGGAVYGCACGVGVGFGIGWGVGEWGLGGVEDGEFGVGFVDEFDERGCGGEGSGWGGVDGRCRGHALPRMSLKLNGE